VDPRRNPYSPNAGARPPVLVGRESELEDFDVLLHRLAAGHTEKSLIVVGLRGVGKTVLLGEFHQLAIKQHWRVVEIEAAKWDDGEFRRRLAIELRRVLLSLERGTNVSGLFRRAVGALKSFALTVDPSGSLTIALDGEVATGTADTGALDVDLAELLTRVGEAAKEQEVGVALLLDELHYLTRSQMEAVIMATHKTVQRTLPITVAAAGLPHIHELVGQAKTYAERLFKFPSIKNLSETEAIEVLTEPARQLEVRFSNEALREGLDFCEGYPYFLQEYGKQAWDIAHGNEITGADGRLARQVVQEKLDSGFFKVRLDRTTELQKAYLRAMAELGPEPQLASKVAELLQRTSPQCGPIRKQLIDKGLLYATDHGYAAFTVPKFDEYLKRVIPVFEPKPARQR